MKVIIDAERWGRSVECATAQEAVSIISEWIEDDAISVTVYIKSPDIKTVAMASSAT